MDKKIIVKFVGDVMLGELLENYKRGVKSKIINQNINPFEYCKKDLNKSELNIANLECVISNKSNREKPFSDLLRIPTNFVNILKNNNINIVNIANNHSLDHGVGAFNEMVKTLNEAGIKTFGYAKDNFFQKEPLLILIKNIKFGFLGYNIANLKDDEIHKRVLKIRQIIPELKRKVDILILSLHWGYEYTNIPAPKYIKIGKELLDLGVDILYGHHSHQIQGVVKYKGKIFAPSLGNFIFDDIRKENRVTGILKIEINGILNLKYSLKPYFINLKFQPKENPGYLNYIKKLNRIMQDIIDNNVSEDEYNKKVIKKSKANLTKNRIRMRMMFVLHLWGYYPYIFRILYRKILKGKIY